MQLHCHSFLLRLIKLIDFSYKTAFPPFYCIISPHPRKSDINHVEGTSRSRCIIVSHRVAEVHVNDLPSMTLELMDYHPVEVLVVHCIVRAESCGIVVVDDRLVRVRCVIGAEVGYERRDFALELDVKGFEDVQAVGTRLTAHNPVDIGIVVHADAERLHRVDVRVRATVERAVKRGELVVGVDGVKILLRLLDDAVVAE